MGSEIAPDKKRTLAGKALRPITIALMVGAAVLISLALLQYRAQPIYEGRRISAWFDDLCLGVFPHHEDSQWQAAYASFSRMDSKALPYLLSQLSRDQGGRMERVWRAARKMPIASSLVQHTVCPSERRSYAAVALGQLGTNSLPALGPIFEAHNREPQQDVRATIVDAMANMVGLSRGNSGYNPSEWSQFESAVLEQVRATLAGLNEAESRATLR